jgi:hypothetical protein
MTFQAQVAFGVLVDLHIYDNESTRINAAYPRLLTLSMFHKKYNRTLGAAEKHLTQ